MNPRCSQTDTPINAEVSQTIIEQLNKVNQDKKLLTKAYKSTQQNHVLVTKAKTSTKGMGTKATKLGKNQSRK